MTDPSTKEGRAELRAICEAATQGPWKTGRPDMLSSTLDDDSLFKQVYAESVQEPVNIPERDTLPMVLARIYGTTPEEIHANAGLFAKARIALPACLDRIEALETEIERLRIAHKAIKALQPSGPHTSAKEGMSAYLTLFAKAKGLAMAALSETEGAEG